jgi:RNA polymerase sigma-70 factor (ECF subfamily)
MPTPSRAPLSLVVSRGHEDASDAELARSLIEGESWAMAETWRRFAPMVLALAERALGSKSEAEDLAQEAFYRLSRTVKSLREMESLRSFVYSIAIRTLKSQLRQRRVRAWLSFQRPETIVDTRHWTLDVESSELLAKFYSLLDRLSARDRLVFVLRRVEGMTVEEIAASMDVSISTVKRSMLHASNRLSRWVGHDPGFADLVHGRFIENE